MMKYQDKIIDDIVDYSRYIEFDMGDDVEISELKASLSKLSNLSDCVVGVGVSVSTKLSSTIPGLTSFPEFQSKKMSLPITQSDLFVCFYGKDPGVVFHHSRTIEDALLPVFKRSRLVDGFKYDIGRDLTGYEDGTENPEGQDAIDAAIVQAQDNNLDGGSFVVLQQWLHNFQAFDQMSQSRQDQSIGRYRESNEEFDAPESAHVKRTAQESFEPEAFLVRRSMPWSSAEGSGLMFTAFTKDFSAFEIQMNRMIGKDDGIIDGIFEFTVPISGSYYWCPPVKENGEINFSALGV